MGWDGNRGANAKRIVLVRTDNKLQTIQVGPDNATLTIKNLKITREKMKKLRALIRIEFFSQQNDTKIINVDESVLILRPFF